MAFIEERDGELGFVEDVMEKKKKELDMEVRIGHPFTFLPSSSSSSQLTQHYLIPSPALDAGVDTPARSSGSGEGEREHMFEKVVTPSDVGKLNRLVIPKQHAEKYFPLDSSATEKGLLLSFEDRSGKPWRFRYSYWNSSQSYVMTKGWSRFVKEKKLDAGDIVSFYRSCSGERFFIDWRRRPDIVAADASLRGLPVQFRRPVPWGRVFLPPQPAMQFNYGYYCLQPPPPAVFESVPVAHGKAPAAGKRVRLFGVNLEQCSSGEDSTGHGHRAIATTSNLLPLFCGGDDSTSNKDHELQRRKTRPSLSLDLDI